MALINVHLGYTILKLRMIFISLHLKSLSKSIYQHLPPIWNLWPSPAKPSMVQMADIGGPELTAAKVPGSYLASIQKGLCASCMRPKIGYKSLFDPPLLLSKNPKN